jgi:hypothetical protein
VPRLSGTWSWDRAAQAVTLEVRQVQPGAPFDLTVEVGIQLPGAPARVERVRMTGASVSATFKTPQEPASVVLDPNVRVLADLQLVRR